MMKKINKMSDNAKRVVGALCQNGGRLSPRTLYTQYDMSEPNHFGDAPPADHRRKASALLNIDLGTREAIEAGVLRWNDDEVLMDKMLVLTDEALADEEVADMVEKPATLQ